MKLNFDEAVKNLLNMNRYVKRFIILSIDLGLCIIATWIAFYLRLEKFIIIDSNTVFPILFSIILALPIFWVFGFYRTIFRFSGISIILTISLSTFVYGLLYFSAIGVYSMQGTPRSIGIIQPLILFFLIIVSRLSAKYLLESHDNSNNKFKNKKKY